MKLIIEDDEGHKTVVPVVRDEITIGRQDGNTIKLTERNVSRRHARLFKNGGALVIEDLGSYNGVRVNGDRISAPVAVKEGDLIEIGDYDLGIQGKLEAAAAKAEAAAQQAAQAKRQQTSPGLQKPAIPAPAAAAPAPAPTRSPTPAPEPAPEPAASSGPAMTPASSAAAGATAIIRVSDLMKSAPSGEVRDLQKNEMPRLVGLAGAFRAKEFYLMRSEVKFGRTEENDIALDHQSVSRQHGRFALEDEGWKVYDNKSANGVQVNGEQYAVSLVKPGDTIELGHVKFRFCAPGEKFAPPPEKKDGAEAPARPLPTTAELIAGASRPAAPAAPAKKSNVGLLAGVAIAVVLVVGGGAYFALSGKKGAGGDGATGPSGDDAVKAAKQAEAKKDFKKASELLESAGPSAPASYKKKMYDEAQGQETYEALEGAIAAGDFDKAKGLADKCAGESTWWCGKAGEKSDAVKAGFAKKHLAAAASAKNAGRNEDCQKEAGVVLGFDPNNSEAQSLSQSCAPQQKEVVAAPAPKKPESSGPSQKERDEQADSLNVSAVADIQGGNLDGAMAKLQKAMSVKPSQAVLAKVYRTAGIAGTRKGDMAYACKYLGLYRPLAPAAEQEKLDTFLTASCKK